MMSTADQAFTQAERTAALQPGQHSLSQQHQADDQMTFG